MMGFGMGFGLVGLVLMFLFWGILILGAVWLVKVIFSGDQNHSRTYSSRENSSALDILAQRYARGEITREQYENMKQDLM